MSLVTSSGAVNCSTSQFPRSQFLQFARFGSAIGVRVRCLSSRVLNLILPCLLAPSSLEIYNNRLNTEAILSQSNIISHLHFQSISFPIIVCVIGADSQPNVCHHHCQSSHGRCLHLTAAISGKKNLNMKTNSVRSFYKPYWYYVYMEHISMQDAEKLASGNIETSLTNCRSECNELSPIITKITRAISLKSSVAQLRCNFTIMLRFLLSSYFA